MTVDVIIPLYRPDNTFYKLLQMLLEQTIKPKKIILIHTETKDFTTEDLKSRLDQFVYKQKIIGKENIFILIKSITEDQFDHGGSRHMAAQLSESDYLVYFTQDAIPKNKLLIENILEPFSDQQVAIVYGRQLAKEGASDIEIYTRLFNYPEVSNKKTKEDRKQLGIKTYFCSNVCAAYKKDVYVQLGGFHKKMIFNEDMLFATKAIEHGYAIYYNAKAIVYHSHEYSWVMQFKRNFDLGVSQKQYSDIFNKVHSEGEGFKLVKQTLKFFFHQKKYLYVVDFMIQTVFKYAGYVFGKWYQVLPRKIVLACSMNKSFWKK